LTEPFIISAPEAMKRKAIFKENKDKKHFLHLLDFEHSKYQATFHAYVLMDNHYSQAKKGRDQSFAQKLEKLERDLSNFKT
jgi:hypothetical protein